MPRPRPPKPAATWCPQRPPPPIPVSPERFPSWGQGAFPSHPQNLCHRATGCLVTMGALECLSPPPRHRAVDMTTRAGTRVARGVVLRVTGPAAPGGEGSRRAWSPHRDVPTARRDPPGPLVTVTTTTSFYRGQRHLCSPRRKGQHPQNVGGGGRGARPRSVSLRMRVRRWGQGHRGPPLG